MGKPSRNYLHESYLHRPCGGCWTAVPWISCWIRTSLGGLATVWINAIFTCRPECVAVYKKIIRVLYLGFCFVSGLLFFGVFLNRISRRKTQYLWVCSNVLRQCFWSVFGVSFPSPLTVWYTSLSMIHTRGVWSPWIPSCSVFPTSGRSLQRRSAEIQTRYFHATYKLLSWQFMQTSGGKAHQVHSRLLRARTQELKFNCSIKHYRHLIG